MTLVLVRLNKLLGLRPPHLSLFCLSYVHDQEGFDEESHLNRTNPLFARTAQSKTRLGFGFNTESSLKKTTGWGELYSLPYTAKLKDLKGENSDQRVGADDCIRFSFLLNWAEGIVFPLLRCYLHIRAYLTNLKLSS